MPNPYASYPDATAVIAAFTDVGLPAPTSGAIQPYIDEAVADWERDTRYRPFLQTGNTALDFTYDPPGPNAKGESRGGSREMLLDRGFLSIATVTTDITPDLPAGIVRTLGTEYRTWPYNASIDLVPITKIEFTFAVFGLPGSIKIHGVPGYAAVLPATVWNAIRKDAASRFIKGLREQVLGSAKAFKSASGTQVQYSDDQIKWGDTWAKEAEAVKYKYTLPY